MCPYIFTMLQTLISFVVMPSCLPHSLYGFTPLLTQNLVKNHAGVAFGHFSTNALGFLPYHFISYIGFPIQYSKSWKYLFSTLRNMSHRIVYNKGFITQCSTLFDNSLIYHFSTIRVAKLRSGTLNPQKNKL